MTDSGFPVCAPADSMGFHKVANRSHAGSATLHCYIPPPKMCRIWMNPDRFFECHTVSTARSLAMPSSFCRMRVCGF
jgi:hypothetical protein